MCGNVQLCMHLPFLLSCALVCYTMPCSAMHYVRAVMLCHNVMRCPVLFSVLVWSGQVWSCLFSYVLLCSALFGQLLWPYIALA